ncbi:MAG TPA: hypothetical protein VMW01_07205 [Williamwhitmania sp.]|nr:hypothetical protein [Williamwhitmania sp.]
MIRDRLFGMVAAYKTFNFASEFDTFIPDYSQSSQLIKDPIRAIYMDSDGVVNTDLGIDGLIFNPYALEITNAEAVMDVDCGLVYDLDLFNDLVDIYNIQVTRPDGSEIQPYDTNIKVAFSVSYGDHSIKQIRYSLFSDKSLNYKTHVDTDGLSRSYTFDLDVPVAFNPSVDGDTIVAQINIEDVAGNTISFFANKFVSGYAQKPSLEDLKIYQRNTGDKVIDIYYTYMGLSEIDNSQLSVQYSKDGGATWSNITSLSGDYGANIQTGRRRITWRPDVDLASIVATHPIFCKLTLYDADENLAVGNVLTGALVWNIGKPEVAVMKVFEESEVVSDCPNGIEYLTADIVTEGIFPTESFLTVDIDEVGGYYIQTYTDTIGLDSDDDNVFWGNETNSVTLTTAGFVSIVINGTTYYTPVFGGNGVPGCHSNINSVLTDVGTFTSYGFAAINVNNVSVELVRIYTLL